MGTILSLQGCMAAGKTTAARWLSCNAPELTVFFEENAEVIAEVRRRGLDKTVFADYCAIQRLWIAHELERWPHARQCDCALLDYGPEEIEFYTLRYPRSIGQNWPVEQALAGELAALRRCRPDRILFLQADADTLRRRKERDATRDRGFFEHTITALFPLKTAWFGGREDTDFLDVSTLSPKAVGEAVRGWAMEYCTAIQPRGD